MYNNYVIGNKFSVTSTFSMAIYKTIIIELNKTIMKNYKFKLENLINSFKNAIKSISKTPYVCRKNCRWKAAQNLGFGRKLLGRDKFFCGRLPRPWTQGNILFFDDVLRRTTHFHLDIFVLNTLIENLWKF